MSKHGAAATATTLEAPRMRVRVPLAYGGGKGVKLGGRH
jgi:hypothetical protein